MLPHAVQPMCARNPRAPPYPSPQNTSPAPPRPSFSEGGTSIEDLAEKFPDKVLRMPIDPFIGMTDEQAVKLVDVLKVKGDKAYAVTQLKALYKVFSGTDATLVEVNPLAESHGKLIAADAKVNFDDNASFRQKELFALRDESQEDPREVAAHKFDLNYIGLDGNIGCMVNGAGLAMATMVRSVRSGRASLEISRENRRGNGWIQLCEWLGWTVAACASRHAPDRLSLLLSRSFLFSVHPQDIIKLHGGAPANFLDVGGSASEKQVVEAFRVLTMDSNVKALLVNIFGGIMKCDVIASGIVNGARELGLNIPLVVRLEGTNVEAGKKILRESGLNIIAADDLDDAAKKAVKCIA